MVIKPDQLCVVASFAYSLSPQVYPAVIGRVYFCNVLHLTFMSLIWFTIFSGFVYFEDGIITAVSETEQSCDKQYDFGTNYVSPGFIDIHTHGAGGYDFAMGTEAVINGCNFQLTHGTTSICPTVSAAPMAEMIKAVRGIEAAKRNVRCKANIIGAHMEGPYLSSKQCGAQSPDMMPILLCLMTALK